jgi:hypothetical protein
MSADEASACEMGKVGAGKEENSEESVSGKHFARLELTENIGCEECAKLLIGEDGFTANGLRMWFVNGFGHLYIHFRAE